MGCGGSSGGADGVTEDELPQRSVSGAITKEQSRLSESSEVSQEQLRVHHNRLRQLRELDGSTKIPFIMIELRGIANKDGYIEICGKDEYGVYVHLDEFFLSAMGCTRLDAGDLSDDTPLPFCDGLYKWEGFMVQGSDGTNNMGIATMTVVDFMCNKLSWTLGVVNGGNVGKEGEIREQQLIFKAPHPMNMEAHHMMIELRSAGYIEVTGSCRTAKDTMHKYFVESMNATPTAGHQDWSDRYYRCADGVFKERGKAGENNLGGLTVQVCDAIVALLPRWHLVTMNGGNYGEGGSHREQQLVFRCPDRRAKDIRMLESEEETHKIYHHVLVELREAGYIEVCGKDADGFYAKLSDWLQKDFGCKDNVPLPGQEPFCDKKFKWKPIDMMVASARLVEFFHLLGWAMQVCSQGTVNIKGNDAAREQQIVFRHGASNEGYVEPHIFIELYTGDQVNPFESPESTLVPANQFIRIREVGNCRDYTEQLSKFLVQYLGAVEEDATEDYLSFGVDVFLSRGLDNNLGCWTMRICDFMVDFLGWSFVVCNVCNLGPVGTFREQQLVFRFDGERREIPPVKLKNERLDEMLFVGLQFPSYWKSEEVLQLKQSVGVVSCVPAEIKAMQEIFDHTFKRVLTRDRVYEYQLNVSEEMPFRLEVVHMFRSEHAELYRRFMERKSSYPGGSPYRPKTLEAGAMLNSRLGEGEALLAHGTNPSSSIGILKTGFKLSAAGKSTGTMFGYGIYLAECVSKSDEYARDDNGGTYPGLMALLICRALVGNPYVVQEAGDYIEVAKQQGCDCVVGDRESKVGTYKEFIFFDERQVLPEYAVMYRRQFNANKVPSHMRSQAKGTTGRNWQVKLDKGWANIPPDVSFELSRAQESGISSFERNINDVRYAFDFSAMTQTNLTNGTTRQVRPPMRRQSTGLAHSSSTKLLG